MLSEVKTLGLFYWSVDLSWLGVWTLKCNSAGCWTRTSDHTNVKVSALTRWAICWPLGSINWHIYLSFLGHWASKWTSAHHRIRSSNLGIQSQIWLALSYCHRCMRVVFWWIYLSFPGIVLQNATVTTVRLEPATLRFQVSCLAPWAVCWLLKCIYWHNDLTLLAHWTSKWKSGHGKTWTSNLGTQSQRSYALSYLLAVEVPLLVSLSFSVKLTGLAVLSLLSMKKSEKRVQNLK